MASPFLGDRRQHQNARDNTSTAMGNTPKSIYIVGAQSTGKTTLANALKMYFDDAENHSQQQPTISAKPPKLIAEVARNVLRDDKFTTSDVNSSPERAFDLQRRILNAQARAESTIDSEWFISDRSGLDPIIYAQRYIGKGAAQILLMSEEWKMLEERMRRSLVIVCEPKTDWLVNDGVRLMPENEKDWRAFHELFCAFLKNAKMKYIMLSCDIADLEERIRLVVRHWESSSESTNSLMNSQSQDNGQKPLGSVQ
jgi:nicotinamide riboside kinase